MMEGKLRRLLLTWQHHHIGIDCTDTLIIYTPQKEHSMTVYYATGGFKTYDSCIPTQISRSYTTIIGGDNPYTVINVPENPQDQNILVFKDSFGNAMIPYLVEHYGNIHIVDPRYAEFNITEFFKDLWLELY